jgi:hypothetical protein
MNFAARGATKSALGQSINSEVIRMQAVVHDWLQHIEVRSLS